MRIEQLEFVWAFETDRSVLLSMGPQLQGLAAKLKGKTATISIPEQAPPEMPRLVIQVEKGLLQVGLNRFQLTVQPPDHVTNSYSEAVNFAKGLCRVILDELVKSKEGSIEWTGIVTNINYPSPKDSGISALQAAAPVFRRLTTLPWEPNSLASFQLQAGQRVGDFFRTYTVAGYDIRKVTIAGPTRVRLAELDFQQAKPDEVGVSIILDVNSKPSSGSRGARADYEATLSDHALAYTGLALDLNLQGII